MVASLFFDISMIRGARKYRYPILRHRRYGFSENLYCHSFGESQFKNTEEKTRYLYPGHHPSIINKALFAQAY